ncbi:amidohydrolase [Eisenibacter elegans]|uniref:amidohydrolase n=1 Tax=Eisenibacter elegans TaxID=997 RepID=UPI0003F59E4F|nr:amidohydrolase [Eisenibacter elegans]
MFEEFGKPSGFAYLSPMTHDLSLLIQLRRYLHRYPALSGQEQGSADYIADFLRTHAPPDAFIGQLGGSGLAAIYEGAQPGETVVFRAELDALPIQELGQSPHTSYHQGVAHLCGHDGHSAILAGLGLHLRRRRPAKGRVVLLFQPAEETGQGAAWVLQDRRFQALTPDWMFALHNLPQYPLHALVLRDGAFTAAVQSLVLKFLGKTAHAAEPEYGHNPANTVAALLLDYAQRQNPNAAHPDFRLVTPVHLVLGEKAYGVAAGHAELHLTLRAWENELMQAFAQELLQVAHDSATRDSLALHYQWVETFNATQNNPLANNFIRQAAQATGISLLEQQQPFKWGEDFGLFTQHYKGAMFGLGAGQQTAALHNPDYDFPDEIIETGLKLFLQISRQLTDID